MRESMGGVFLAIRAEQLKAVLRIAFPVEAAVDRLTDDDRGITDVFKPDFQFHYVSHSKKQTSGWRFQRDLQNQFWMCFHDFLTNHFQPCLYLEIFGLCERSLHEGNHRQVRG